MNRYWYIHVFLFVYPLVLFSCTTDMDEILEEKSEPKELPTYYVDTLTIAHWNIGHFSLGRSGDTTIKMEDSERMASLYRTIVDSVDADVFGICEYNPTFSVCGEKTSDYIFGVYPFNSVGTKYSYNCNAIFSKAPIKDNKAVVFEHCVQHRYYLESKLLINDKEVFFVETHLDFNQGESGRDYRAEQIQTLVKGFSKLPYVIICADYNISYIDELHPFVDAGFSLANGGKFGLINTYTASNPSKFFDNIVVKGFDIISTDIISDNMLSDHCIIKSRLLFNQ